MPAFPPFPDWDLRRREHDADALVTYGWEEDMTEEFAIVLSGPITRKMLKDENAIPALFICGDKVYAYKRVEYCHPRRVIKLRTQAELDEARRVTDEEYQRRLAERDSAYQHAEALRDTFRTDTRRGSRTVRMRMRNAVVRIHTRPDGSRHYEAIPRLRD